MKHLKVLMLLHDLSRTGAPKLALDLVEALADRIDIRFAAADDGPLAARCGALGQLMLPFAGLPRGRLAWRLESRRRKRAWSELRAWAPDLVYANSVMSLPLADRLDRTFGMPEAPMLLHVHELDSLLAKVKSALPDLLMRPAYYVGVSQEVCRRLVDFAGVDPGKVLYVPEFVKLAEFAEIKPRGKSDGSPIIVGGAGTPSWRKKHDALASDGRGTSRASRWAFPVGGCA